LRGLYDVMPILTKHYALGLLVGTGFGLFLAYLLAEAGVVTDAGSRRLLGAGVGLVAIMVGGTLYALDVRKSSANPPGDRAEPGAVPDRRGT
jgi:hypothetical protein